ncbi:MAG: M3 family metallopeptidase [Pseudomonadota bacterium]
MTTDNPLLAEEWATPFGLPPFDVIKAEHFRPAFDAALAEAKAETRSIAESAASASFETVIEALERAGRTLDRVAGVFFNLVSADADDALQAIQTEIAPKLAAHRAETLTDPALFAKVQAVFERRAELDLTPEQDRVLELYHRMFIRAGAALSEPERARMGAIMGRLAELGTAFTQNLLKDEAGWALPLETPEDEAGLPDWLLEAAASAAEERGREGAKIVTLSRSLIEPFLQFSTRRDLREIAYKAWAARGAGGGATDNRAIVAETLALRAERAALLGFETYAAYKLDPEMAKTPANVSGLLSRVWEAAKIKAAEEQALLTAQMIEDGVNDQLRPWDWRFYAERERRRAYDLDEGDLKPYLSLDNVRAAAFATAERLFGLAFRPLPDAPRHHPDVAVYEVLDAPGGAHVGLFLADDFNRASKRSGAWMSAFRSQSTLTGESPIVVNVQNFAKAPRGKPTLLTLDDARTLFHEFGHALHGLLSDVTYPFVSGTSVARDFVELPSQLYEHWLTTPEILSEFARHVQTGAPMPEALREKLAAAETFNQGFATVEYLSSALVDLALHEADIVEDPAQFEQLVLAELGAPAAIPPRHRVPHFAHLFSGEGYAAGYYSYMWAEVMDADAFQAFEDAGDRFDAEIAGRLRTHIYAAGGATDPAELYKRFRGRLPGPEALMAKRGLVAPEAA